MLIGEISRLTGASAKAIRHYETLGLLKPGRQGGGYRVFDERDVYLVRLIREAQQLGFKLGELKSAVSNGGGAPDWQRMLQLIRERQQRLVFDLERIREQQRLLQDCEHQLLSHLAAGTFCT